MSFEGYGRTFDLRMESNVKKLFHNDLQIIVNSANGTQSKLGLKDIDTSVFYGGYLEREQRSSEVTAHIDRGVLVAHIHTVRTRWVSSSSPPPPPPPPPPPLC